MSVMLQNSFSLSNLSCNVDNGDSGSLVAAVHNLDLLNKKLSNKNSAKKIINTQKIKFWQAPNA
jgi:hypothetical protein